MALAAVLGVLAASGPSEPAAKPTKSVTSGIQAATTTYTTPVDQKAAGEKVPIIAKATGGVGEVAKAKAPEPKAKEAPKKEAEPFVPGKPKVVFDAPAGKKTPAAKAKAKAAPKPKPAAKPKAAKPKAAS